MSEESCSSTGATGVEEITDMDFVYCGKRLLANGKVAVSIRTIRDGKLDDERLFGHSKKFERAIGVVYSGASFSANSARGIAEARYARQWAVQADLIDWRVRDEQVDSEVRVKKLEADAKRTNEIERLLLPLRSQYERYRKQHDHAGMEALTAAVLRALVSSPRTTEQG
ncbi:hypothetical protein [Cupriavidus sp. TMH.W2]|uniref:hypothetical protein n=1 Tax=Cupriavidus sp. TMH.W2 TaxID=3434465 RepID=UPI003D7899F4